MENKHTGGANDGYEKRDANPRSLFSFAGVMFLTLIVVGIGMKWMFDYFSRVQQLGPPATPFEQGRTLPPLPRLQVQPVQDLAGLRQQQDDALHSYGWVDRNLGTVRIPIDRAMDLLLERGLPVRPGAQPPADHGRAPPVKAAPAVAVNGDGS
jgi:hypothetical protein